VTASSAEKSTAADVPIRAGGVIRALAATLFWSSSALQIDRLTHVYHLTALQISAWRILLVLPVLTVFMAVTRRQAFRIRAFDLPFFGAAGLVGITLSYVTWAVSVRLNGPAIAAALSFCAPAFVAVGERVLFGVRLQRIAPFAIGVNLVGCALASGLHAGGTFVHSPLGLLAGLGNGLSFAAYTLLNRRTAGARPRDQLTVLFGIFAAGGIGLVLWGLLAEGPSVFSPHLDLVGWAFMGGVALGPTLLAYAFFNSSLRSLPATYATLVTTLEPPLVALGSLIILQRSGSATQWVGIVLIVGAVLAMQLATLRGMHSNSGD
jgi:drug/metabolite transporter, DME family